MNPERRKALKKTQRICIVLLKRDYKEVRDHERQKLCKGNRKVKDRRLRV